MDINAKLVLRPQKRNVATLWLGRSRPRGPTPGTGGERADRSGSRGHGRPKSIQTLLPRRVSGELCKHSDFASEEGFR